ncbi:MAG TPA: glycosyltransferase [Chthoniobacterales bacterium]|nr:glycosyltransferase [Chthoniobacterales bacterium]
MKRGLNIAFFGSSLVSAYWNGAATYYRGIVRALHELGHRTTFFEPDAFERQQHRDLSDPWWADVVVYPGTTSGMQSALGRAREANVIVKASGVGIFDAELEAAVLGLKRPENVIIFWDVDAPATLDRLDSNGSDPFHQLVPQYDLVLTYGGGNPVVTAYKLHGARACIPIYNALDPFLNFPVEQRPDFVADLAFLGNRLPDREARVDEFFVRAAQLAPRFQFLLGGSGWGDRSFPHNVKYVDHLFTKDLNAFNCSARLVLNISRESMARYGFSPATRLFEAAGAGACLVTDYWDGLEDFLEPDREVLVARNGEEVAALVKDLDEQRRRRIGKAARKRVLADHTYVRRALEVEEVLQSTLAYRMSL